jgi:mRNA interferase RelE/StbE
MRTIVLTSSAAKDLDGLPAKDRESVENGLIRYAISGDGDVRSLKGRDGYRLRIGEFRVLFDQDRLTILAVYIGRRDTTTYRRDRG